jgi:glycosyltransferase involved in cell wall biosynthesis
MSVVKAYAPRARVIFDTTDLHHVRAFRAAKLTGNARALRSAVETKRDELAMARASDVTLVVSPLEQQALQRECSGARVHVVSNIHAAHGSAAGFAERRGIVFVGAFAHHPNADAMQYFFDEIYPLLRSQLDAPITVIGSQPPAWLRAKTDSHVIVTGHVRDLASYLNRCRLTIAPLRYGAGVKGKVLESMSYGVPVVGTSIAAEGIPAHDRREMLIADAPARFCDAVIELYSNQPLWNQLSANGLALIQNYYSASSARIALVRVFEELSLAAGVQA